jgi:hypothetical protein
MRKFNSKILFATVSVVISAGALMAQNQKETIAYPDNYHEAMAHYATVDRADNKVYELYVNLEALNRWREERSFPVGTTFVIESFDASLSADGKPKRDASGNLIKGASDNEIHVSEKQDQWSNNGECTTPNLMAGQPAGEGFWRMAAFDPRNGARIANATQKPGECHQCHMDRRAENFILSRGLLDSFARSGEVSRISFDCGEREICFGGPSRPLSVPEPICPSAFPG